jgi:hypothetical protein
VIQIYENRQAVVTAIENADYDAWKEAVGDCPWRKKSPLIVFQVIEAYNCANRPGQIEEELGITVLVIAARRPAQKKWPGFKKIANP